MGLAIIHSRASIGVQAPPVTVEVHISNGMPGFTLVGLPETTVKESRDRVRSAIINSRFEFPAKRITVNLAPADLPKEGGRFDLPIALGILAASDQIARNKLESYEFIGELALSGEIRGVKGVLPAALAANQVERCLVVPHSNGDQAALVGVERHVGAKLTRSVRRLVWSANSIFVSKFAQCATSKSDPRSARHHRSAAGKTSFGNRCGWQSQPIVSRPSGDG